MCGIAGYVTLVPRRAPEDAVRRMSDRLRHRGPDDEGYYHDDYASLGHRRLSIIDLAAGHQPMSNEAGNLWITYNGEIFNHQELRTGLERAGHVYRTRSDTETILHAFEEHGADCVSHFRGMFAFAIWDSASRRLFCARDRLGIKPFYYYWDGSRFLFASEIKALLAHPAVSPALDESVLAEHLAFGYTSGERTLFSRILKLMPGHRLLLTPGGLSIECYWDVPAPGPAEDRDDEDWIRECRERLEETVRLRLMSDVPLGMFLSGGVDSSAVAALMRRLAPGPVKTFAVGYPESEFSELEQARRVSQWIGAEHSEVVLGMEDFFRALPELVWHEDEPVTWPSSVPLYFVSRLASRQVKVVLTGEGGDELFGGYGRYRYYLLNRAWAGRYRVLPAALRRWATSIATSRLLPPDFRRKLGHTFLAREDNLVSLYLDNFYSAIPQSELRGRFGASGAYDAFLRYWERHPAASPLFRMLYTDQKTYLVELLMKQDRMSMATSIESRVPFLDHPLVEFASRVPDHLKIRGRHGKYILKRAVEDLLPRQIVYGRKMGFPTPLRRWLLDSRAGSLYALLRDKSGLLAAYVPSAELEALIACHRSGIEDSTDRIWRLLNLQIWGDLFLAGRRERFRDGLLAAAEAGAAR